MLFAIPKFGVRRVALRLEYYVYMAENSTGKERSLVGIAPRGVPRPVFRREVSTLCELVNERLNSQFANFAMRGVQREHPG